MTVFYNALTPQQKLPGRDADAVNELLLDPISSSIHSATSKLRKNQPVVQVRRDYAQDILDKMRECITQGSGTTKLRAR